MARRGPPPRVHAAQSRRLVVPRAHPPARRLDGGAAAVRGGCGARCHRAAPHHHRDARAVDDLRVARPPEARAGRPVEPADGVLRRVAHLADPAAGGDPHHGTDLLPVLRADGIAPDGVRDAQGGARPRRPRSPGLVRSAPPLGAGRAPRRRRQGGAPRRSGRALRAGAARDEGLLAPSGGDRGGARRRVAAHRRRGPRRRRRVPHHRRPQEGHDRVGRLQHLPPRGGRRDRRASCGRQRSASSACPTTRGAKR